jgi:hypothetical protein
MGIIYEVGKWCVEARTKSIAITLDEESSIEVNYEDLDGLESAIQEAQKVRRDKKK